MYPSTKQYLKREILKLINKTNDNDHEAGKVSIWDIIRIAEEIQQPPGTLGYLDVDHLYME
jgi:hypothetical protein